MSPRRAAAREATAAAGTPMINPPVVSAITWRRINQSTFARFAPSATLMPISLVRRATA